MRLPILFALMLLAAPACAQPLPREVTINGVEFVLVPEGWFWYTVFALDRMEHNDERPRHRSAKVWIDNYYIAKYEARARDMERFMNAGAASAEALEGQAIRLAQVAYNAKPGYNGCTVRRQADGRFEQADPQGNLPATNLSWTLADEFARWMGFRLPTEAEWQKAARGTDKRIWPWGDTFPDDTYATFGLGQFCLPAAVDSYPKGRSPYGLHHMAGNVQEFVADWYNWSFDQSIRDGTRNPPAAQEGPQVPDIDNVRMTKGGRWSNGVLAHAVAVRTMVHPHSSSDYYGVRFAIDSAAVQRHIENGTAAITRN